MLKNILTKPYVWTRGNKYVKVAAVSIYDVGASASFS